MADDAAARRELRRQRILANSEDRLKKITEPTAPQVGAVPAGGVPEAPVNLDERPNGVGDENSGRPAETIDTMDMPDVSDDEPPDDNLDFSQMRNCSPEQMMAKLLSDLNSQLGSQNGQSPFHDLMRNAGPPGPAGADQLAADEMMKMFTSMMSGQSLKPPSRLQKLQDAANPMRTALLILFAAVSRLLLPSLPEGYEMMFLPLYLLDLLIVSICFGCRVPMKMSMTMVFTLLQLLGMKQSVLNCTQTFLSVLELLFHDMWVYAFGFLITHALCESYG